MAGRVPWLQTRTRQPQHAVSVDRSIWPGRSCVVLPSLGRIGVIGAGPITALSENQPFSQVSEQGRLIAWRPNNFVQPGEYEKWTTGEYIVGSSFSMIAVMGWTNGSFPATVQYGSEFGWGARLHVHSWGVQAQVVVSSNQGTTIARPTALRELVPVGMTKRGSILTLFCNGLSAQINTGESGVLRRLAGGGIDAQTNSLGIASLVAATDVAVADDVMRLLTSTPAAANRIFAPIERRILYSLPAGGGAQTIAIGQVIETSTVQAFTSLQHRGVSQVTETATAQAFASLQSRGAGQVVETSTAQAFASLQRKNVGQVVETSTAQTVGALQLRNIGQVVETSTAQVASVLQQRILGQVTETSTVQSVSVSQPSTLGQVSESNAAQVLSSGQARLLSPVTETDAAQVVTFASGQAIGLPLEIDTALAFASSMLVTMAQAVETDFVFGVVSANDTFETYPLKGDRQGFPLSGLSQVYPLAR